MPRNLNYSSLQRFLHMFFFFEIAKFISFFETKKKKRAKKFQAGKKGMKLFNKLLLAKEVIKNLVNFSAHCATPLSTTECIGTFPKNPLFLTGIILRCF